MKAAELLLSQALKTGHMSNRSEKDDSNLDNRTRGNENGIFSIAFGK